MNGQNENISVKGVADVVFVVDSSGSMSDILAGLKTHIKDFVRDLLNSPQSTLSDVRLGLVTHDVNGRPATQSAAFVSSDTEFATLVDCAPGGGTEFGLPAIDLALDFPWRVECRRYIAFFTDEPVEGGHEAPFQRSKLQELCKKMAELHVHLLGIGPECPSYDVVGKTPGSDYKAEKNRQTLEHPDMKDVLIGLAKTITGGVDSSVFSSAKKNIYTLRETPIGTGVIREK
jgi:hypothetical protein